MRLAAASTLPFSQGSYRPVPPGRKSPEATHSTTRLKMSPGLVKSELALTMHFCTNSCNTWSHVVCVCHQPHTSMIQMHKQVATYPCIKHPPGRHSATDILEYSHGDDAGGEVVGHSLHTTPHAPTVHGKEQGRVREKGKETWDNINARERSLSFWR